MKPEPHSHHANSETGPASRTPAPASARCPAAGRPGAEADLGGIAHAWPRAAPVRSSPPRAPEVGPASKPERPIESASKAHGSPDDRQAGLRPSRFAPAAPAQRSRDDRRQGQHAQQRQYPTTPVRIHPSMRRPEAGEDKVRRAAQTMVPAGRPARAGPRAGTEPLAVIPRRRRVAIEHVQRQWRRHAAQPRKSWRQALQDSPSDFIAAPTPSQVSSGLATALSAAGRSPMRRS